MSERSLSRMSLTESRLYCRDQVVGLEVWQELVSDDLFNDFRDERHVSDWSKVAWVSWVESLAFDDRDLFWAGGNTPSTMDRLQIVVRSGSNMSRCSCRRNVGRGSSSHDCDRSRRNDDMTQFSRGDSRHRRQAAGRGWKCRRRRASGVRWKWATYFQ